MRNRSVESLLSREETICKRIYDIWEADWLCEWQAHVGVQYDGKQFVSTDNSTLMNSNKAAAASHSGCFSEDNPLHVTKLPITSNTPSTGKT
jgi:hypothetical protein